MNKIALIVVLLTASCLSFAQTIEKTYFFDNPSLESVNGYDVITFGTTTNNGKPGEASIPWQMVSLLLPQNSQAEDIIVEYSDFVELEGSFNLFPQQSPRPISSTEPMSFEKNEEFYSSESVYPEHSFSKVETQYLNGCSFAFAQFSPVRYVPASGRLSFAKKAVVKINLTDSKTDKSGLLWLTPEIQGRVERLAQNPEAVSDYKVRTRNITGYELLVITPQEWVSHFDEYVSFYNARGLRTRVAALEEIYSNNEGRDEQEKIRTYIKYEYENNGIMMVLLGGDAGVVPYRSLYCFVNDDTQDNLPADMYYVCLDGTWNDNNNELWGEVGEDDLLPELAVARMPFNNETQFNNMMHKTLRYQDSPVLGEFHDVILGAEHLGDGYYGSNDLNMLIGGSSQFDYTTVGIPEVYDFHKVYADGETGWNGSIFRNAINNIGGQYVHHVGHANTDYVAGWYVSSTNDASFASLDGVNHNYNFFHTHGCICGDFTHNCILERLVNISTGFVATTGNSRYGWYVPWGDGMAAHLHREFVDSYYNDRLPYIGTAFVEMKIMTAPYVNEPWGDNGAMRWNIYDLNILGDVAVCPWLDEPFIPEIRYPSALQQGVTAATVTVKKQGVSQNNFRCSLFNGDALLAFGLTNDDGIAELLLDSPLNVTGELHLIVTGPNAWPQTLTINAIETDVPFVFADVISVSDPLGNNNGLLDYSETASLQIAFSNAGSVTANNVIATLSTTSPYINIQTSECVLGSVSNGGTANGQFDLSVSNETPDGEYADFSITCTDGVNSWSKDFSLMLLAPVFRTFDISFEEISGDMNGYITPGDVVEITLTGENIGNGMSMGTVLFASTENDFVTIENPTVTIGDVYNYGSFSATVRMNVSENAIDNSIGKIMLVSKTESGRIVSENHFDFAVGLIKEGFESGDFSNLIWLHEGDEFWTVTDTQAHSGTFSAQTGNIADDEITSLLIEMKSSTGGEFSFYFKTSTEKRRDYFVLYIDEKFVKWWSGEEDWTLFTYTLEPGNHLIEWRYDKSPKDSAYDDACWLDDITFPGNSVIITAVTSVEKNGVTVFPNPADNNITVLCDDVNVVEIYNLLGRKVGNYVIDNECNNIDISDFCQGVYIIRIIDVNGNVSSSKIIKK
ncbi:MAG: C25 family cysteine peptidase [Candidatus Limimorpha sp.]